MNENLKKTAYELRDYALDLIYGAKTGHIGGDFSEAEIMAALYFSELKVSAENPEDPGRDYFILSKGHSMEVYYAALTKKGFLDAKDVLERFSRFGSPYIGHPNNKLPGIEMNSGSLGHGLPVSVGIAKAMKMDGKPNRVYVLMGDGELAEGSVWEGAMAASHYGLDNLLAIVDRNRLQISGPTETVMHHDDLAARFMAFGWNVIVINGNDMDEVLEAFAKARETAGQPTVVIAETTKGKGVSFIENKAVWHHKVPSAEEYEQAKQEIAVKIAAFSGEEAQA
ncbi:MAG: transketolase [Parasporobacterium sp.]|nr:transketolase [Parasporobacterium sp.]